MDGFLSFFICKREPLSAHPSLSYSLGPIKWKNINIKVLKHKRYDISHYCFDLIFDVLQHNIPVSNIFTNPFAISVCLSHSPDFFSVGGAVDSQTQVGDRNLCLVVLGDSVMLNGEWIHQISSREQDLVLLVWFCFLRRGGKKWNCST